MSQQHTSVTKKKKGNVIQECTNRSFINKIQELTSPLLSTDSALGPLSMKDAD